MKNKLQYWSRDYDAYLKWCGKNGINYLVEAKFQRGVTVDEIERAMFGEWYCEVKE
jgi:hypothetical protein